MEKWYMRVQSNTNLVSFILLFQISFHIPETNLKQNGQFVLILLQHFFIYDHNDKLEKKHYGCRRRTMLTPLLHYPIVFFSFTRPYMVDAFDYSLTQEKRRYEYTHRTVEITPKGNEKDITTQNEDENASTTKVGYIAQGRYHTTFSLSEFHLLQQAAILYHQIQD